MYHYISIIYYICYTVGSSPSILRGIFHHGDIAQAVIHTNLPTLCRVGASEVPVTAWWRFGGRPVGHVISAWPK